jgi:hypothetical protein
MSKQAFMDELLRAGIPQIKLALGEAIDRENARPLPTRYARLLPESMLLVTLRPDAADALQPIAMDLERELTDSCTRNGSLYDRVYRVRLQRSGDPEAPLYTVSAYAGRDIAQPDNPEELAPDPEIDSTRVQPLPVADPDVTRIEPARRPEGWEPGRWVLVVEDLDGREQEAFTLGDPVVTVGRRTDNPQLKATIAISDAAHVSRRQLALVWDSRSDSPGFRVYNLGLNTIHLPGKELRGSRAGKDATDLETIGAEHVGWVAPEDAIRIGDEGPVLRIEELPPDPDEGWIDPDATVYG